MARRTRSARPKPRLKVPPNPGKNPLTYDAFSRQVRQFKTQQLLRLVAKAQQLQWLAPEERVGSDTPLAPHAASLVAFEAMGGWGAQRQIAPTPEDLRRLNAMVIGLEDPILTAAPEGATDDFMVRVSYQQFLYQQPPFNATARLRPMFSRTFDTDRFTVISLELISDLLGVDIDTYADLAPFFLAAVMSNNGRFDPTWFGQPNFREVNEVTPPEKALEVFKRMRAEPAHFRAAAREGRHEDSRLRQYDFNPLVAKPFIELPDGSGLAPQPTFVTDRFAPNAIYYSGLEHLAGDRKMRDQFLTELGYVNEDYVVAQLQQLSEVGAVVGGAVEYARGVASVDASVVLDGQLLLFEVKSTRPNFNVRVDATMYRGHMGRDIHHGFEQLESTYQAWLNGDLPNLLASLPVAGFLVTPEPFHMANWTSMRVDLPPVSFPVAIISFTELEELVAACLADAAPVAFVQAATPPPSGAMQADPRGALHDAAQRNGGRSPRNPMLDDSFDVIRAKVSDQVAKRAQGKA